MTINTLEDVFAEQVGDLISAEGQLVQALPQMARAAADAGLRDAFQEHLEQTREHVARLQQIAGSIALPVPPEVCKGMMGLIAEGDEVIGEPVAGPAKDAALIAAAQRVEHYEIAAYGSARALAKELGYDEAESLLDKTLDEESAADKLLTKIATGGLLRSGLNAKAAVN